MSVMITKDGFLVSGSGNGFVMVDSSVMHDVSNAWLMIDSSKLTDSPSFESLGIQPIGLKHTPPEVGSGPSVFTVEFNRPLIDTGDISETAAIIFRSNDGTMNTIEWTLVQEGRDGTVYSLLEPYDPTEFLLIHNAYESNIIENTTGKVFTEESNTSITLDDNSIDTPLNWKVKFIWTGVQLATAEIYADNNLVDTVNVEESMVDASTWQALASSIVMVGSSTVNINSFIRYISSEEPSSGYLIQEINLIKNVIDGYTITLNFTNSIDGISVSVFKDGVIGDEYNDLITGTPLIEYGDLSIPVKE